MAKKLTKSARIRRMLERGNTVKQITAALGVSAQMVYQIRSADKKKAAPKKAAKPQEWVNVQLSTSGQSVEIPKDVYEDHFGNVRVRGSIQPKDYPTPKQNVVQRFFNWLCGG